MPKESSAPVKPTRIDDEESAVPTWPPTLRPTQISPSEGVADVGLSTEVGSAQVMGAASNRVHEICEAAEGSQ